MQSCTHCVETDSLIGKSHNNHMVLLSRHKRHKCSFSRKRGFSTHTRVDEITKDQGHFRHEKLVSNTNSLEHYETRLERETTLQSNPRRIHNTHLSSTLSSNCQYLSLHAHFSTPALLLSPRVSNHIHPLSHLWNIHSYFHQFLSRSLSLAVFIVSLSLDHSLTYT